MPNIAIGQFGTNVFVTLDVKNVLFPAPVVEEVIEFEKEEQIVNDYTRYIDDTLWDIVRVSYYNRELPQDLIKDIQQKIKVGNKRLEDNQEKLKRIELRFIQGKISEEMADSLRSQTKQEGSTLSKQLKRLEYQLESLKEPETVDIDSVIDPAICSKFVREVISEVKVTRESKKVYRLEISYNPPFFGPSSILLDHGKVSRLP
jgi:hypothetical protein